MARALLIVTTLLLTGCAHRLGYPKVEHGAEAAIVALVQPSSDERRWYVPVDAGDAGQWVLFVDTGYTNTTCDDDFVAALGVQEKGHSRVYGELGSIRTGKAVLPPLQIGQHKVLDLVCQTRDLATTSSISDPTEVPVAGVLGMDVLRHFRTRFDAGTGQMELLPPAFVPSLKGDPHAVTLRREQLGFGLRTHMELDLDGEITRALVDTGATDTYVDGKHMGLQPSAVREGVTMRGTGGSGSRKVDVLHYDIERVKLGAAAVGPITLTDRKKRWGSPGLLGQDVLGLLRSDFDWTAGRALFVPVVPANLPSWASWSVDEEGDVIRVLSPDASSR